MTTFGVIVVHDHIKGQTFIIEKIFKLSKKTEPLQFQKV